MANNKFIHLLLACALFAACDDNDTPVDESKPYPAVIMAEAFDYGSETGTTWFKGETIGVYMLKGGTDDIVAPYSNLRYYANSFDNQDYFLPGNNDSIPYFPATGDKMDIAAYYPQTTVLADSLVAIHLINNYEYASQLLFARVADLNKDSRKAELRLRPVLTQFKFLFKLGNGMSEADLKGLKVNLKGMPVSGFFNATTGRVHYREISANQDIVLQTNETKTRSLPRATDEKENEDAVLVSATGLVLPSSTTTGYHVLVELPAVNKSYPYKIPNSGTTENLKNSTTYTFSCTINEDNMDVSITTSLPTDINNWGEDDSIDGKGEETNR